MYNTEVFVKRSDRPNKNEIPRYDATRGLTFSIQSLAEHVCQEQSVDKPHRHPYFEIIWMTGGDGICYIDMERHIMRSNTIYCIPPGHIHSLVSDGNASGFVISFTREFIHLSAGTAGSNFYNDMLIDNAGSFDTVHEQEKTDLENVLCCLEREFRNYYLLRPDILSSWLRIVFSYLKGMSKKVNIRTEHTKNAALVNQFYASLERDFLKKKMVIDYANELFISPNYLNEIVKRISGFTASHHIQQRIVLEAKRLAIYSSASMKEIAYLLGFEDIAYFSKFFKTFSGTNFRNFKKSNAFCDLSFATD